MNFNRYKLTLIFWGILGFPGFVLGWLWGVFTSDFGLGWVRYDEHVERAAYRRGGFAMGMNRDRLFSQPAESAATSAFTVINGMQDIKPEAQVTGVACAFKFLCDALGLNPAEVLVMIGRMENDCRYRNVNTLAAVREYINHEIKRKL